MSRRHGRFEETLERVEVGGADEELRGTGVPAEDEGFRLSWVGGSDGAPPAEEGEGVCGHTAPRETHLSMIAPMSGLFFAWTGR